MKTTISLAVGLAAFVLPLWTAGRAADPVVAPTEKGRVLLLRNERVLEGDVERVGSQYRVKRQLGETWVPAAQVLHLCADFDAALAFLRGRANLRDPDERLRLAQWCHLYGLSRQAIAEVEAAVHLRPEHRESRRLLEHLQQTAARATAPQEPTASAEPETVDLPSVELDAEAIAHFSTRVQPILMNACANCHATGRGGSFKLTRVYSEHSLNRKTVQQNLASVLAQVNPQRPLGSPLLTKSVTAHGELVQAPLKGRQAVPYRTLEDWVRRTIETSPQMQEPGRPTNEQPPPPTETPFAEDRVGASPPAPVVPMPAAKPPIEPEPSLPVDPFDPVEFNRQKHPDLPQPK